MQKLNLFVLGRPFVGFAFRASLEFRVPSFEFSVAVSVGSRQSAVCSFGRFQFAADIY